MGEYRVEGKLELGPHMDANEVGWGGVGGKGGGDFRCCN